MEGDILSRQHLILLHKQVHDKGGIAKSIARGLEYQFCVIGGIYLLHVISKLLKIHSLSLHHYPWAYFQKSRH